MAKGTKKKSDLKSLLDLCSASERDEYLAQKQSGGANFQKGATYENRFAVWKLADQLLKYLEQDSDSMIESQKANFYVDDLVIENLAARTSDCFQLKNRKRTEWGTGRKGSLVFDCYWQTQQEASGKVTVVVSSERIEKKLNKKLPNILGTVVTAQYFPKDKLADLLEFSPFKTSLGKLSNVESAPRNILEQTANILLAAWHESEGNCVASTLVSKISNAKGCSLRAKGTDSDAEKQLRPAVKQILERISNLKFVIQRGYFHYSYGFDKATFPFDCYSQQFSDLQDWIERNQPKQYVDDLERELLRRSTYGRA